jgi:ferritin-like metal-binding protein YciE
MAKDTHERLLEWLGDAHAMEKESEALLSTLAVRIEHYPELKQRLTGHVAETRRQAESLLGCIERLGGSPPALKGFMAKTMGSLHAACNALMSDEVVKGAAAGLALEHLEISMYRALVAAAEQAGDRVTQEVCEEILQQERAMADWLSEHLEATVLQFLWREQNPELAAKR